MAISARVKDTLRWMLGDRLAARIHGRRFARIARGKIRESPELLLAAQLIHPGETVIDIGANGADWDLMMSNRVGPTGNVIAFEAHPYYAEATRQAIRYLKLTNVVLESIAVGDRPGQVQLEVKPQSGPSYSGRARIVGATAQSHTVTIPVVSLDQYLASKGLVATIDFIKSDTEGYELNVFRGAIKTLESSRPLVQLEVGHGWRHGFADKELQQIIDALDYQCFAMDQSTLQLRPIERIHTSGPDEVCNRLIAPRENTAKLKGLVVA